VVVVVVGVAAPVRWRRGESARGRKGKEARPEVGVGLIVEQRRNKWKAELCALVYTARLLCVDCGLQRGVFVISELFPFPLICK
jgi:hypothetical protein